MKSYRSRGSTRAVLVSVALVLGLGRVVRGQDAALLKAPALSQPAPDAFTVNVDTSAGPFVVEVHRDWAPVGADRFYNLVKSGFLDGTRFFRIIPGYIAVFGINGDPAIHRVWRRARIPDEPRKESNKRGYLSFNWQGEENTRTTLLIINLADNPDLDQHTHVTVAPFGRIVSGLDVVDKLYSGYGETAPSGNGPDLYRIYADGNAYLEKDFPKLDYIKTARIVP
jgi:peptidyl-prolyl cis-trans isomerase A (cyclophilin A)